MKANKDTSILGGGPWMSFHLLMLGPPVLTCGSQTVHLKSRKGQALLFYLATQPHTTFIREHLHGLLWDDVSADFARRNFNTMLSRLRTELPIDCFEGSRDQLGWHTDDTVTTDIGEFLERIDSAETKHPSTTDDGPMTEEQKQSWYEAIALWRGPFLAGFSCDSATYEEWMTGERHRWEIRMFSTITRLVDAEISDGRWAQVVNLARQALQINPLQESLHRAAMEALFRQGNRSAALAQFELCRHALNEQLRSEPDAMTTALYQSIKASKTAAAGNKPLVSNGEDTSTPSSEQRDAGGGNERGSVFRRIVPDHLRHMTRSMPPLIGRDQEYALITDTMAHSARRGQNHVLLLYGEAGIGKTRLLSEVIDAASAGHLDRIDFPTILVGRAHESMLDVPFAPFVNALEPVLSTLDLSSGTIPDVWLRELGRLLPDVFVHRPDLHPLQPVSSGDERLRLFQAVAKLLSCLPQPVLITLDDLQWADPFTVSLLAYILRRTSDHLRVTAVITVRAGDDPDSLRLALNTLEREQQLTRVELSNLTEDDTFTLLEALFPEEGPSRATRVYSQSLGHPLYTLELMTMLTDGDVDASDDTAPFPVPRTVQEVFVGRLGRLGTVATDVADALSLFRRGATLDQLFQVTQHPETSVVKAVERLSRARIVEEHNDGMVTFKHDVFSQVVLEKLSPTRQIHLHRQAYAALAETITPEVFDETPPTIVDQQLLTDLIAHAVGGHMWEEAFRWTRHAANVAERLYAFRTAVEYMNKALLCLEQMKNTHVRREQRFEVELQVAKLDTWSPPEERHARLKAMVHDARAFGLKAYIPRIHMAQADSLILQGRCTEARALLNELAPLAARDPRLSLVLLAWRGAIDAVVGDVTLAITHLRRVQKVMGEQVLKPGTSIYAGLAACCATAGNFEEADDALEVMKLEEKQQGYESLTSKYLTVAATVAYLRDEWHTAINYARQGLLTSRTAEDPANEALSALWFGASGLELATNLPVPPEEGIPTSQEALQVLEEALAASKRAQSYTRRDFIYAFLALAYSRTGRPKKANEAIADGLQLAQRFGYKEGRALCTEIRGRMAADRGDLASARRHLTDARDEYESLGNVTGVRRCHRHLNSLESSSLAPPPSA